MKDVYVNVLGGGWEGNRNRNEMTRCGEGKAAGRGKEGEEVE